MVDLLYKLLLGFCGGLKGSPEDLPQEWEAHDLHCCLHHLVLLLTLSLLTNFLSIRPHAADLLVKQSLFLVMSPTGTEFAHLLIRLEDDIHQLFSVEWVFIFAYSTASIIFSAATILTSAPSITGQGNLTGPGNMALAAAGCWKRPFVTYFYVSVFGVGYVFLVLAILLPHMLP